MNLSIHLATQVIIKQLLAGGYMRRTVSHSGKDVYRVYSGGGIISQQIKARLVDGIEKNLPHKIFNKNKKGRITILRRRIQQLHGNYLVKRIYKEQLKVKQK